MPQPSAQNPPLLQCGFTTPLTEKAGLPGKRRGQQAAALDAMGAAIGSFGLLAFAAIMWTLPGRMGVPSGLRGSGRSLGSGVRLFVVGLAARAAVISMKARRA